MSNFKRILEVEKEHEFIVSKAERNYEIEFEKFKKNLVESEEKEIKEFKEDILKNYNSKINQAKKKAEKTLEKAKDEAEFIEKNSKIGKAVEFLLEEVTNV